MATLPKEYSNSYSDYKFATARQKHIDSFTDEAWKEYCNENRATLTAARNLNKSSSKGTEDRSDIPTQSQSCNEN